MSELRVPKIVAHRGFSGHHPELTRRAFEEALKLPIHGIECDVRLSRDGRVVVFHDSSVNRTTDGRGRVDCICLLYTSPSPRDRQKSRMPSSA